MSLKLAVPSKGRLMDKTFDWFGARGVALRLTGADREYAGAVEGAAGIELVLMAAGEIPRELAAGRIHLGVTGADVVQDKIAAWDQQVEPLAELGFGQADLVLAVPAAWVDVDTLDDLDAAAAQFRTTVSPIISWSTARARPRARLRMKPPRPLPTSPRPAKRYGPIT